jgi:thioredoxin reductase (NADPH)
MIDTDAVVIGAGPVGLFQVFQLGLLGLKAEIIDVLPEAGGQCVALYPDKPIYDIPGVPLCTGRELATQLLTQAQPFLPLNASTGRHAHLHLGHLVSSVQASALAPDGSSTGYEILTDKGLHLRCKAVFVAAGAGAFVPKTLNLPALEGACNVHHHLDDAANWAGQHVLISGGGDEALSAALQLASTPDLSSRPAQITLLHRRDQFQADAELTAQVRALIAQGLIELALGMPTEAQGDGNGMLITSLSVLGPDGQTSALPLDHLLIRQGMSPKLGPLSNWGLQLERKQVPVSSATFESATPGIYAVGDINTYPGKKRLLLCGFHEATLAAHAAATTLHPDAPQHLLYTTTSPLLHQRLGLV